MRWQAELRRSRVTQSKESDAFASQGVERLIRPVVPNWADSRLGPVSGPPHSSTLPPLRCSILALVLIEQIPRLGLGVMPTKDVLLVSLRGGRPRIRQLGEGLLTM